MGKLVADIIVETLQNGEREFPLAGALFCLTEVQSWRRRGLASDVLLLHLRSSIAVVNEPKLPNCGSDRRCP